MSTNIPNEPATLRELTAQMTPGEKRNFVQGFVTDAAASCACDEVPLAEVYLHRRVTDMVERIKPASE